MAARNTRRRDQHRRILKAKRRPCHICHEPIDYDAHWLDPLSFTIDHLIPINRGGADRLDNIDAAHRKCNRDKSDRHATPPISKVTERTW